MRSVLTLLALWFGTHTEHRAMPAGRLAGEWRLAKDKELVAGFPDAAEAERQWFYAREHAEWVEWQVTRAYATQTHAARWYELWEKDARWCLRAWYLLTQCRNPHTSSAERANSRYALECHLGYDDYTARRMPPPAPDWWFREE